MLLQQVMNDTDVKSAFEFFDKLGIKVLRKNAD